MLAKRRCDCGKRALLVRHTGWASVNEDTQGPQIWDVVENHIRELGTVKVPENNNVQIIGA